MVLFDGAIYTTFGLLSLASGDFVGEAHSTQAFEGQTNGLCGGAVHGGLLLNVGVHTGDVRIRIDLVDTEPPLDSSREEIVEASVILNDQSIYLRGCATDSAEELLMPEGVYRARFCGTAYGAGEDNESDAASESYLLTLWPDVERSDALIKATRPRALSWHEKVRQSGNTH